MCGFILLRSLRGLSAARLSTFRAQHEAGHLRYLPDADHPEQGPKWRPRQWPFDLTTAGHLIARSVSLDSDTRFNPFHQFALAHYENPIHENEWNSIGILIRFIEGGLINHPLWIEHRNICVRADP